MHNNDKLQLSCTVLMWLLMWLYASRDRRLLNKNLDGKFITHLTRQYTGTGVLYFLALVLSLWNGIAGLILQRFSVGWNIATTVREPANNVLERYRSWSI